MTSTSPGGLKRKVGLDKPCRLCGKPIYFGYQGPVEGVCGRCSDRRQRTRRGSSKGTKVLVREKGKGVRVAALLFAFLAGAAAMLLLRSFLPF